ncbi:uncharacterized protein [Aristolochia californica]|uniref:uncharacterized protein n=1 Tax=Aristolochia californica TaxID=171875 RepID=UPI0035DC8913
MIDAASGGPLVDKTPEATRNLIANIAANSQQFGTRLDLPSKNVNEVNISSLEQQIVSLIFLVRQMTVGNTQIAKACGFCLVVGHPTDMCPSLQEEPTEQVNVADGFPGQPQMNYDSYSNTYKMGRRDHPKFSYGNPQVNQPTTQNHPSYQQYRQPYPPGQQSRQTSNSGMSLEDIVKSLTTNNLQFQQETRAEKATPASSDQEKEKNVVVDRNVPNDDDVPKRKFPPLSDYKPVPPFPQALADSKKYEQNKDLYENFHRCEVNIIFLDVIKQVPRYAKFLKELCTIKRKQKLKGCERVIVGENVSTVIQRKFSANCKDPGMFTISCTLSNTRFEKAMIDLGASINVMPYFIYASLKLGPLNKTGVVIQLADRSNADPKGVVEDVLVQFNIYDAMKYPGDDNLVYSIDVIDSFAHEVFELDGKYELEVAISKHLEKENEELALSFDL